MLRLLSDEEIKQAQVDARPGGEWSGEHTWRYDAVCAAQLALDKKQFAEQLKGKKEAIAEKISELICEDEDCDPETECQACAKWVLSLSIATIIKLITEGRA